MSRSHSLRPSQTQPRVTFVGPVQMVNGLGVSARGYASTLMACGASVHFEPWTYGFEAVHRQNVNFPASDRGDINLIHLNLDLLSSNGGLLYQEPLLSLMGEHRYNILIPYWELMSLRPEWLDVVTQFDEIWCASHFMTRAFSAICRQPVRLVRPMVTLARTAARAVINPAATTLDDRFRFFYAADIGSSLNRKNPELFWRAYSDEFKESDGTECILKLHYAKMGDPEVLRLNAIAKGRNDMHLLLESKSADEMALLWDSISCYVSPHRSEGLGLTVVEAMLMGKPVIATPYGGAADLVSEETAFPIAYTLAEVGADSGPYPARFIWSEPDAASLRQRMREVFFERGRSNGIAKAGQKHAQRIFGTDCVPALRAALDQVVIAKNGNGPLM